MTQVKVVQPFGFEQVGSIIDLEVKDAIAKVKAGLAEFVGETTPVVEPIVEEAAKEVATDVTVEAAKEVEPAVAPVAEEVAKEAQAPVATAPSTVAEGSEG
jgi:hypothetical protein